MIGELIFREDLIPGDIFVRLGSSIMCVYVGTKEQEYEYQKGPRKVFFLFNAFNGTGQIRGRWHGDLWSFYSEYRTLTMARNRVRRIGHVEVDFGDLLRKWNSRYPRILNTRR